MTTRERDIIRGYGGLPRTENCACGGIIAAVNDEYEIEWAVQEHQQSTLHQQWRKWRERLNPPPESTTE